MPSFGMFGGNIMPGDQPQVPQMPMPEKRGMFGGGKVQIDLGAALAGFAAGMGNPAGAAALRAIHEKRMMAQQQAMQDQQYQQQRQDGMQDWMAKQDYQTAHPQPDDFTQLMMQAHVDPASPQGQALYMQYLQNKANPFQAVTRQNPDGSEVREFMRPPMPPSAPVGNLTPINGGPTPPASGSFPY